ncbi:rhodanese-like domain-containing protein [Bacillus testis]|uniref:rhodanese-like domain-containing protein n=1 Tax=Bacillus testis TaxID=1622072 RepID=UPI00067E78E1|nr:rhodanese-like domain-containing protein [Bacillus testis]
MSTSTIIVLAVIVLFFVWRMMPTKGVNQITTSQLKEQLNDRDKQFVDVRTPGEYRGNHIKQFQNIPLGDLRTKASKLSKDKEVVVICQSGMRSSKASKELKQMGFQRVTNVKGGMSAWH